MIKRKRYRRYSLWIRQIVVSVLLAWGISETQAQPVGSSAEVFAAAEASGKTAAIDTNILAETIRYIYKLQRRAPDSCIALLRDIIAQSRKAGFLRGLISCSPRLIRD